MLSRAKRRPLLAVLLIMLTLAAASAPAAAEPDDLVQTQVSYPGDGQTLHGTVIAPNDHRRHPGLVLVAGAGSTDRNDYRPEAEAFARAGITTLIYDKRSGYSRASTSLSTLASDAVAGVALLSRRPNVIASRVGLWGHSQGGWVVPIAASQSSKVAYVIVVGASALSTDRTQLWSNRTYLTHAGVETRLVDPIAVNLSRMLIAAGQFGDTRTDPYANLTRVRQPILAVFGGRDRSTAPGESLALFRRALTSGGNDHYTLRVISNADHTMHASADGFEQHADNAPFAPGFIDMITSWITESARSQPTSSADPPPDQTLVSSPTVPLRWYESPVLQLSALVVMLLAFLGDPIGAAVAALRRRLHRTESPQPAAVGGWPARVAAITGPLAVLGAVCYLFWIVATGATQLQHTVLGRPPVWLVLQLLSYASLIAGVVTVVRIRRAKLPRYRIASLLAAVIFLPWALYWGLLTP